MARGSIQITSFADAVLTSAASGDAPDFDMPAEIDGRLGAAASEAPVSGLRISSERSAATDDQLRARSSALFPAKAKQVNGTTSISSNIGRVQEFSAVSGHLMSAPSQDDGLFVRRSPERGRNDRFELICTVSQSGVGSAEMNEGRGEPTDGWQDKSAASALAATGWLD